MTDIQKRHKSYEAGKNAEYQDAIYVVTQPSS